MRRLGILLVCCLIAGSAFWVQCSRIDCLESENGRLSRNTDALLSRIDSFRLDSSHFVAEIQVLELTVDEYERYRSEDRALIDRLGVQVKNLESAAKHSLVVEVPIETVVRDTVFVVNDSVFTGSRINWHNEFVRFSGVIRNDIFKGDLFLPVTLNQFIYVVPKRRFLWWSWGVKAVKQVIVTDNPYVFIEYSEFINLKK